MTQEEKNLLIKDLCARLPYHIFIEWDDGYARLNIDRFKSIVSNEFGDNWKRPYLRPMSSMTEEELNELFDTEDIDFNGNGELVRRAMLAYSEGKEIESNALFSMQYAKVIDWLNAHHFDYRGLISIGLALEAPEGMYKED